MKALAATILCATIAQAQVKPVKAAAGAIDWSISAGIVASRALDYASTERCIHSTTCHEIELPAGLVRNTGAFAAFEVGSASLELWSQHELIRHNHRGMARAIGAVNVSLGLVVDEHNYQISKGAK